MYYKILYGVLYTVQKRGGDHTHTRRLDHYMIVVVKGRKKRPRVLASRDITAHTHTRTGSRQKESQEAFSLSQLGRDRSPTLIAEANLYQNVNPRPLHL